MHARVTRYEGAAPDALEDALQTKKRVLPTEFGQTEGMKGTVFLVDRQSGTVVAISAHQAGSGALMWGSGSDSPSPTTPCPGT